MNYRCDTFSGSNVAAASVRSSRLCHPHLHTTLHAAPRYATPRLTLSPPRPVRAPSLANTSPHFQPSEYDGSKRRRRPDHPQLRPNRGIFFHRSTSVTDVGTNNDGKRTPGTLIIGSSAGSKSASLLQPCCHYRGIKVLTLFTRSSLAGCCSRKRTHEKLEQVGYKTSRRG